MHSHIIILSFISYFYNIDSALFTHLHIRRPVVLGLIWQTIKLQLMSKINVKKIPALIMLLHRGETVQVLNKLPPEQILLRWVNFHLEKSQRTSRSAVNFGSDLSVSL